jgi:hypothetical protein
MGEHVDHLKQVRARLVEHRRKLAAREAAVPHLETLPTKIMRLQGAIEALDRAIADEQGDG